MASETIELNRSAASGSYIIGKIVCDATADHNLNNSDVTCRIYVHKGNDSTLLTIPTSGTWAYSMNINGKAFSGTVSKDVLLDWVLLATVSVSDIAHNDDGTKSIAISGWVTPPSTSVVAGHKTSGSGTFTLDTVPRASDIASAADVTLGYQCVVKWTPASASFRYRLTFEMGNWGGMTDVIHPNRTTEYTYTGYVLPLFAAHQIPNLWWGTMKVTLYTYSDSGATIQIGTEDTKTFTVYVPDNGDTKPKVAVALSPVGELPSAFDGLYIQGMTKVKASLSAEGQYGAGIASYYMRVDGEFSYDRDAFTSGYLQSPGYKTVYCYAIDKRGFTGETTQEIHVIPYISPKLENASAVRCDQDGNADEKGTYLRITARRSYSPVVSEGVQKNFCSIMYRCFDGVRYTSWVTILDRESHDSNDVTTVAVPDGGLSAQKSYLVHLRASDDVGRYSETFITIPTENVYMHRDGARNALGLGKYNERDNAVDSDWDFYMNGNRITGLPMPVDDTDAVPKAYAAPADISMRKSLSGHGWYKIGTLSGNLGNMCAVATVTIGGVFYYNPATPSMVDIATHYVEARAILRLPALLDEQISMIGVTRESDVAYGVYAYYNTTNTNPVVINVHTHMGTFESADLADSTVSNSNMVAVVNLKE
jgi:hypothetical protein